MGSGICNSEKVGMVMAESCIDKVYLFEHRVLSMDTDIERMMKHS